MKIRGRLHEFGPWSGPDIEVAEYLDQRDDLQGGRILESIATIT